MKKRLGTIGMLLFLGLTIVFQVVYYVWIRETIFDEGVILGISGDCVGDTPRDVADHFVCCGCLSMSWAIWNVVIVFGVVLLIIWKFQVTKFNEQWQDLYQFPMRGILT